MKLILFILLVLSVVQAEMIPVATEVAPNAQFVEVDTSGVTKIVAEAQIKEMEKNERDFLAARKRHEERLHAERLAILEDERKRKEKEWAASNRHAALFNDERLHEERRVKADRERADKAAEQKRRIEKEKADAEIELTLFDVHKQARMERYRAASYVTGMVAIGLYMCSFL